MKHKFKYSEHQLEMVARTVMFFNPNVWPCGVKDTMHELLMKADEHYNGVIKRAETAGFGVCYQEGCDGYDAVLDFYVRAEILFCGGEYRGRLLELK